MPYVFVRRPIFFRFMLFGNRTYQTYHFLRHLLIASGMVMGSLFFADGTGTRLCRAGPNLPPTYQTCQFGFIIPSGARSEVAGYWGCNR